MSTPDFPGRHLLIEAADAAVVKPTTPEITDSLRRSLCALIRDERVKLPPCVFEPDPVRYARRELYHSDAHGYSVIAMTWGPGQGAPIHDHDGMWCVEGVWNGELDIVQYELCDQHEQRYRLQPVAALQAGQGSAGSLIPPHEHHSIRNPSRDAITVSLHIYSGPMQRCAVFEPTGEEHWYQRNVRQLGLDQTH
ncbi:MAG: cysteine dioxygenase [Rhodanobacter sp.]